MTGFLVLAVAPVAFGVLIGRLAGGRFPAIAGRCRALWLLWLASAVQVLHLHAGGVRHWVQDEVGVPMIAVVFAVGIVWLVVNLRHWPWRLRLPGMVVLAGAVANGIAIAGNGRMPYSPAAAALAGVPPGATSPKNTPATADSTVVFLGDVIPVPWLHKIVSAGDVLIALGVVLFLVMAMRQDVHASTGEEVTR